MNFDITGARKEGSNENGDRRQERKSLPLIVTNE
jgi:hypothetical protein